MAHLTLSQSEQCMMSGVGVPVKNDGPFLGAPLVIQHPSTVEEDRRYCS